MDKIKAREEVLKIRREKVELFCAFWKAETHEERQKIIDAHDPLIRRLDEIEEECFGQ